MVDVELYGGRRAYLEHIRARMLHALGAYRSVRDIEWAAVRRLAFVCKGNICRSPYACARARFSGVPAVSFGLKTLGDQPADPAAARNALYRGIDLSAHRSAQVESTLLTDGDLIIVFEPTQLREIRRRFGVGARSTLLGIWSQPLRPYIHDPYGSSDRYFNQCFGVIDGNIAKLVEHMALNGPPATGSPTAEISCGRAAHEESRNGMPI